MNQLSPVEAFMALRDIFYSVGEEYGASLKDKGIVPFMKSSDDGYVVSLIHNSEPLAQIIAVVEDDMLKVYSVSSFKFPSFTYGTWYEAPMVRGPEGPDFEELHEIVASNFENLSEYASNIDITMLTDVMKQTEGSAENPEEAVVMAVVNEPTSILSSSGAISLEPGQTIKIIRK